MLRKTDGSKGVLTVEACISFTVFMMVILTILFIMRIVYAYALIQHATMQTAKELATYSYLYQITGLNDVRQSIKDSAAQGVENYNYDASQVVAIYDTLLGNENSTEIDLDSITADPEQILKNFASVFVDGAVDDATNQSFGLVAKSMISGYLTASDSTAESVDEKLKNLQVVDGLSGLDLSYSAFFEEGNKIDIVVCYTLDPIFPIDFMPEINLMNRAVVQGVSGKSIISGEDDN